MAGRLYDLTASYMLPFLIAAACGAIAGAAAWRARSLRRRIRGQGRNSFSLTQKQNSSPDPGQ
jgi:hypothetical protein